MTKGQEVMIQAFGYCIKNQKKVFLLDEAGSGFRYTLQKAFREGMFGNTRIISVSVVPTLDMTNLVMSIYKQSCTVKFSNLNKKAVDLHELLVKINSRLRQDLLGKRIFIVFNHVHLLRSMERMQAFVDLLMSIPFPCGVILRTTARHIKSIQKSKDFDGLYATIRVSFGLKKVPPVTRGDVETLCIANGLTDRVLIGELASKSKNLKVVQFYIDKAKKKLPPTSQLTLSFFE
ncbi:MAG: hypothetical protein WBP45_16240 [Daejeonella sp.]